jgi:hypothetical protein
VDFGPSALASRFSLRPDNPAAVDPDHLDLIDRPQDRDPPGACSRCGRRSRRNGWEPRHAPDAVSAGNKIPYLTPRHYFRTDKQLAPKKRGQTNRIDFSATIPPYDHNHHCHRGVRICDRLLRQNR